MPTPVWETERLLIKPPTQADFAHFFDLHTDPDVMTYIGEGRPRTQEEVRTQLQKTITHFETHGFTLCCVFDKKTLQFIGSAGLIYLDYDPKNGDVEVGYKLIKTAWGKGYATELATFFINWGFETQNLPRIVAAAYPQHKASIHVMQKCGMTPVGDYMYGAIKSVLYKIDNENHSVNS